MRAVSCLVCLLAVTLSSPAPLFAQDMPTSSEGAKAIEKGREGVALYEQGKWQEALERFNEADRLYHSPVFALYSARSLRNLGRLLEARAVLRRLVDEKLDGAAPDAWKEAQGDARAELSALEAEIPSVVVVVEGASPDSVLTIDDESVLAGQPIELDPGQHRLVASDGKQQRMVDFSVARGARNQSVVAKFSPPEPVARPTKPEPRALEPERLRGPYVPGLVITGAGGVALITGGVVGTLAIIKADQARDDLPASCRGTTCPLSTKSDVEASLEPSRDLATAADVLLISGAALAAVGIALWLIDPRADTETERPLSLHADRLELRF
jgi:hypothetical protein